MIMPVRWCRFPFYGKGFGPGKPGEGEHGQGDVGVPGGGDLPMRLAMMKPENADP